MDGKNTLPKWMSRYLAIVLIVPLAGVPLLADDDDRVRPRYGRDGGRRPDSHRAADVPAMPEELVIVAPSHTGASRRGEGRAAHTRPHGSGSRSVDVAGLAIDAAKWMAERSAETAGWSEYYRVGFYRGTRRAMGDGTLGTWDQLEGRRSGRRDPAARARGRDLGASAADDAAAVGAEAQVERQFRDLSREPVFAPLFDPPRYALEGTWVAEPALRDVFHDHPPESVPGIGRRFTRAFAGSRWNAWRLHECEGYTTFYDSRWRDPGRAFERWLGHSADARVYRRLAAADRAVFESVFREEFPRVLAARHERDLARAYREGFDDGWTYGAFVSYEWHYRLGYNEGFDLAVASAAERAFDATYPDRYRGYYERAFDDWSGSARPEILSVRLVDANDDGIFQPGEKIVAEYEIANYGGIAGSFGIALDGRVLERHATGTVRLPARAIVETSPPLRAAIRSEIAPRTGAVVDFRLADTRERLNLYISHPLEFRGDVSLTRNSLAGRAVIEVQVVNRSRKPVAATIGLDDVPSYGIHDASDVGVLDPGAWTTAAFELDGLRPLDIIGGHVRAVFTVRSRDRIQDELIFRFPDVASDLHSRDLLVFMAELSRDTLATEADVLAARSLLLRRMRADWRRAVRGLGNPYKHDLKRGGTETALGDLVQTYDQLRGEMARPEVFRGLDIEIVALAEEMPGVHPFLRKSMKRLARRLG
jgi:hypothetical protein